MASLQNSMPVQAIVFCRQFDGRADSPIPSRAADQRLDLVRRDADQHDLLVRREAGARDAVLLHQVGELDQLGAGDPARDRRDADVEVAVLLLVHADVVAVADGGGRASRSVTSSRPRYSFSSTSRNFSTPQSATRNFSRARERSRR